MTDDRNGRQEVFEELAGSPLLKLQRYTKKHNMVYLILVLSSKKNFSVVLKRWFQKQPTEGVLNKSCSENMQQIYRRKPIPKCYFSHGFCMMPYKLCKVTSVCYCSISDDSLESFRLSRSCPTCSNWMKSLPHSVCIYFHHYLLSLIIRLIFSN